MSRIMQAITIGAILIFPCLAPSNAGKDKNDWGRRPGQLSLKRSQRALFRHMRGRAVMIESVRPVLQAARKEMKFGWMQVAGRRIDPEGIAVSIGRHEL